jgi:large subunit ribosomal protein L10
MKKEEKTQIIAEVLDKVQKAKSMFFTDFTGMTVAQASELRSELRKSGVDYKVVKNTLAKRALTDVGGYESVFQYLAGPTGIAFGYDDPTAPAKVLKKFRDKHEKPGVKVCMVEKQLFVGSQLDDIAKLPSRSEMIAAILGSLQSPIAGIAGAISAVMRDLVGVIEAIEKKKSETAATEPLPSAGEDAATAAPAA